MSLDFTTSYSFGNSYLNIYLIKKKKKKEGKRKHFIQILETSVVTEFQRHSP